ncbi:PAS domain S-box protein [Maribacter sp. 1_MG-2023]|uniref:PAS domain S-box protein n=1 Tax=Maribacter sp. 1_MG-2023 TaxID=3062677 RepID=UPI0026E342B0|nr:PAS domain S-box protein [Maribacter sp. 1_MG-2023]MDO6471647.1 PAS domain S-box protein [Maribacter sp. 1_MG-2023]
MSNTNTRSIFKNPLFYGFFAFLIVLIITQFIAFQKHQLHQKTEQQEIEQRVSKLKIDLQDILSQSFNATQTLAFIVEHYGIPDDFDSVAQLLLNSNNSIDALELVNKEGVITHVYPLKGNEVLGLNILNDPDNKFGARTTIEKKDYYTAGPIYLQQGGSGIIGRRPLYKDGEFNGFVAAVVRLTTVINAIQLDAIHNKHFSYQLVKINSDKTEETFYSSKNISKEGATTLPLTTSQGEWKLYVYLNNSNANSTTVLFVVLGILLSLVCGILSWFLMRQPAKLNKLVDEKTALLKSSQERYRLLIEEASDIIILSDFDGNVLEINPYGINIFGYTKEELLNKNLKELLTPEESNQLPAHYSEMREGKTVRLERRLVKKDQTLFYGEVCAKKLNETTVLGIIRDVTERKELELAAEENLVKFSKAYNNRFVGMVIKDHKNRFVDANSIFLDLIGYSLEEIKGKTIPELGLIHIDGTLKTNPVLNAFTCSDRVDKIEVEFISKKGRKLHLITSIEPFEYLGKKLSLSTYIDQTETKKANQEILKSQKKYKQLTERISDAFVAFDHEWCFIDINAKAAKLIGINIEETLGKNVWDEFPEFKNSEAQTIFKNVMAKQVYTYFEQYHEKFDLWIENHLYPSANGLSIYFRDITSSKKADQEKQKLISIIENSPGFIGLATLAGEPLFMNDAGKKMVNLPSNVNFKDTTIFDYFQDDYKDVIENTHLPTIMKKGLWTGEVPLKNFKTKTTIPLEFSGFLIKDKTTNQPIAIGAIGFDLTESKKIQQEILTLKNKMDAAIRIGKIGYWDFNPETKLFNCSPLMYSIFDLDSNSILSIPFLENIIHPEDVELHRYHIKELILHKNSHTFSYRIIVRDNSIKYLMVEVEVVRDSNNIAVEFRGTVIDITEQKKADSEIIELKNRMDAAMRIGKIGYWDFDFNTKVLNWSPRMYEIYSIEPGTEINLEFLETIIHPDDIEAHRNLLENLAIEFDNNSFSYRIILNDNCIKYLLGEIETERNDNGEPIKFRGTIIDITKQKEADNEILSLQSKMDAAIRIGKFGYWYWDMTGDVVEWSKEMYAIHEVDPSTIITPTLLREIIYKEDLGLVDSKLSKNKNEDNTNPNYYRIQLKDSSFKYFLAYSEVEYNDNDEPIIYRGTSMDITKNVLAEEALKESQEKFSKAFQTNLMGMLILDEQRQVIDANETAYSILETTSKKLIGKTILESKEVFIDLKERERLWKKFIDEGEIINEEYKVELKSGVKKTLIMSIVPLRLKGQISYLINIFDDSKRKEAEGNLETQFHELQKTNSELDSFVYSASHELRAPLTSVLGLIQLIQIENIDPKLFQHLNMMKKSIERLDDFIKDIIEYSRNKHLAIKLDSINFSTLIEHSLESLWYLENTHKINIQVSVNDKIEFVSDSKRISIILNNFISNAIKYHDVSNNDAVIWIQVKTNKKEAVLIIKDNGVGIENDQLEKIFEMFYRVSSKVMGSGIGLFIVKEVLSKLNGTIDVKSKIGEGSTFTLKIPNESGK